MAEEEKKFRVLVVDDDSDMRSSMQELLPCLLQGIGAISDPEHVECITASDPDDARKHLKPGAFDLIICDNNMGIGKQKGIDFLTGLREQGDKTPMILHTGDYLKIDKEENIHFVLKGNQAMLLEAMKHALGLDRPKPEQAAVRGLVAGAAQVQQL